VQFVLLCRTVCGLRCLCFFSFYPFLYFEFLLRPRRLVGVPQFEKPCSRQSSDASLLGFGYATFLESRLIHQLFFRGKVHFPYADTDFDNSFYFVAVLGLKHSLCEVKPVLSTRRQISSVDYIGQEKFFDLQSCRSLSKHGHSGCTFRI
jgi:hypothetical protein